MTAPRRPAASSPQALVRMQRQPRRDTHPELALRRELWRRGLRYRVDVAVFDRRRRHDVVFRGARVVVEVRGCFWHACPTHATTPRVNRPWWERKLAANRRRDQDTRDRLEALGWELIEVWEHDDPVAAADRIEAEVAARRAAGTRTGGRPPRKAPGRFR